MKYQVIIEGRIEGWSRNCASYIRPIVEQNEGKHIDVYINSPGGSLIEGFRIREIFANHGDVTAHVFGPTASSATLIAMGCKEIKMSKYALFLVHQCSNWVEEWGMMNADEIREAIERLSKNAEENDKFDHVIASIYADRTGTSIEEVHKLMNRNVYMTAQETLEAGYVDSIINDGKKIKMNAADYAAYEKQNVVFPEGSVDVESSLLEKTLDRVNSTLDSISGFFNQTHKEKKDSNNPNNSQEMAKTTLQCAALAAILGVEAVEVENDVLSVSAEKLNAIEARLAELQSQIDEHVAKVNELNESIAAKDAEIEDLKKKPAEDPKTIIEEDEAKDDEMTVAQIQDMINGVTNF